MHAMKYWFWKQATRLSKTTHKHGVYNAWNETQIPQFEWDCNVLLRQIDPVLMQMQVETIALHRDSYRMRSRVQQNIGGFPNALPSLNMSDEHAVRLNGCLVRCSIWLDPNMHQTMQSFQL